VTINDGDVAALAERSAARVKGAVDVRIEPDPGDDPYRWGTHYWLVHVRTGAGRQVTVRVSADDTEQSAADRLDEAVARLADEA